MYVHVLAILGYLAVTLTAFLIHPLVALILGVFVVGKFYKIEKKRREAEEEADLREKLETGKREAEKQEEESYKLVTERVLSITGQHIRTLALKQDQTVTQDEYGNYLFDRWFQALDYFIDNVLCRDEFIDRYILGSSIGSSGAGQIASSETIRAEHRSKVKELVMAEIWDYKRAQIQHGDLFADVQELDPTEFEHYCANIMRNNGWSVRLTQATGDQGIDLVAERQGIKAVVQCKRYSQPVGNGAVQEIIAGKQFEKADIAAVVTNNTYTASAKQLASATGVYLLHYSELNDFDRRIGQVSEIG